MPSLPTGTVTFLFTDIEGSTTLLQRLDVEAARLLLAKLLGSVILRRVGTNLVAEIEGSVDAMLNREETCSDNSGAGRPAQALATRFRVA